MTQRIVFDTETDNLLVEVTKLHSVVLRDLDTKEIIISASSFAGNLEPALRMLMVPNIELWGHNSIGYDIPVLTKLYPWFKPVGKVVDTLILSRLAWPDILGFRDVKLRVGPPKFWGRHSLEAWGHRLGKRKGDFKGPWHTWSPVMQDYCEQDTLVTAELADHLCEEIASWGDDVEFCKEIEFETSEICCEMERNGWPMDLDVLRKLYLKLYNRRNELTVILKNAFDPWYTYTGPSKGRFTPKRDNARLGYVEGCEFTKVELVEFKPSSRLHIISRFKKLYGWEPSLFTENGEARVDEDVLGSLPYPEAKLLSEYLMIQKRIGQVAEGKQAWMKLVDANGFLHPAYNTIGAVTHRAAHFGPNIGQVTSIDKPYGIESRTAFSVPKGWKQVGVDLSGIELRVLAHYLAFYDHGAYGDVILNGDVHSVNQKGAGLATRALAKKFISMG